VKTSVKYNGRMIFPYVGKCLSWRKLYEWVRRFKGVRKNDIDDMSTGISSIIIKLIFVLHIV
jgi:hypothetical protein